MLDIGILAAIGTPYLAIILPVATIYLNYKRKVPIILNPLNIGLTLLFLCAFYSGIVNRSFYSTLASIALLFCVSLTIYLQHILKDEKVVETFLYKLWKYSLAVGVLGIVEKIASYFVDMTWISDLFYKGPYNPTVENYRIYSTFGNPNVAGAWFAAMVLLSLYLFEQAKEKKKILFLVSMLIFILALISTGSKGATLGLEFAILVYAIFRNNRNSRIILISTFGVILILALLSPEINHSFNNRNGIWEKCFNLFMEKPLTGWGLFGILENIKKTHAHNIWISILTMFGVVGFVLYLWIKVYIFKSLFILYQKNVKLVPLLASIQALIIGHGIVDFVLMSPQGSIMFLATSSVIVGLAQKYEINPYPVWLRQESLATRR